jgi:hypothetical protein
VNEHAGAQSQQAEFALGDCLMFPWGVSWPAGNARASARWQDIATLSKGPSTPDTVPAGAAPPMPVGIWLSYKITLADGQTGTFEGYQPRSSWKTLTWPIPGKTQSVSIAHFATFLEARITNAQLPKAIEAFNAGQAISFGPLTVNSAGVKKYNKLLAWNAIGSAQAGQAVVTVTKKGFLPLPALVTPVTKVPNYCLFAALVDHVAQGRSTPAPYLGSIRTRWYQ